MTRATEGITLWFYNLRSDAPDCLGGRRSAGGSKLAPSSKFLASASLTLPTTRGLGAAPESLPLSLRALLGTSFLTQPLYLLLKLRFQNWHYSQKNHCNDCNDFSVYNDIIAPWTPDNVTVELTGSFILSSLYSGLSRKGRHYFVPALTFSSQPPQICSTPSSVPVSVEN